MNAPLNLKESLQNNNDNLHQKFIDGVDIVEILKSRSQLIDGMLQQMWQKHHLHEQHQLSLIAVGGYGREEMHPASDVDLLVLLAHEPDVKTETQLSDFVTELWDLGLEIGHSVRTLDECIEEATADLTVITNLIESRYLCGDIDLFDRLKEQISPDKLWSSKEFFLAKIIEQEKRYQRFGDTAYRVEPNLKEGPGGLRDMQTIGWIVLREYGIGSLKTLSKLQDNDLLNPKEYESLIEDRDFLWKVRFILHRLTGRKEDRLLFDHQRQLAHSFGYTIDEKNQSIEAFMQRYYKTITELERLNEILLGLLREHILEDVKPASIRINDSFNNENNYLDITKKGLLKTHPPTFLTIFHLLQLHPELKGLTPKTIRELRRNLHLMDDDFRQNEINKELFIKIISQPKRVNFVLRLMNRYGVLAAYIPVFANIVGRMQYDLFHAFTVDDHTLNVVRNIRRLSTPQGATDDPFCSQLFNKIKKPMILVLAGIFHDIAKGREGSHSELGALDALEFCRSHNLNEADAKTVSWLVKQHLLLSGVAQRKDINDPEVIKDFTSIVNSQERLDYLYILTISDIKGTNPTLLTSWKHSLLEELHQQASRFLINHDPNIDSNIENDNFVEEQIDEKKVWVLSQLNKQNKNPSHCVSFWQRFDDDYFQQFSKERLYWHVREISEKQFLDNIVRVADSHKQDSTVLLIYTQDQKDLFVKVTSAIEQQRLDIVGASITSTKDDYDLHTFYLLNREGEMLADSEDKRQLLDSVAMSLKQAQLSYNFSHHRMPRQLKHFDTKTSVTFALNEKLQQTVITIKTADSAGLLTRISEVFSQQGLTIHTARITTLGETAEDIFQVTSNSGKMIEDEDKYREIETALKEKLDV
ncbi:MAG: [protein-PII] uridylyltransferase [Cocleimonas sp.]|jgi:[protein-PII] uridylyltransferase